MRAIFGLLLAMSVGWAQDERQPAPPAEPVPVAEPDTAAAERVRIATERRKAVGEEIDSLKGKKGRVYNKVVITGVDDVGIRFRHESGLARLGFEDLPPAMSRRFGYDAERAGAQRDEESREALESERRLIESARSRAQRRQAGASSKEEAADGGRRASESRTGGRSRRELRHESLPEEVRKKILAYEHKVRGLEAGIRETEEEIDVLREREINVRSKATYSVPVANSQGGISYKQRTNTSKIRKAQYYVERIQREEEKIEQADALIEKYKKEIERLEQTEPDQAAE